MGGGGGRALGEGVKKPIIEAATRRQTLATLGRKKNVSLKLGEAEADNDDNDRGGGASRAELGTCNFLPFFCILGESLYIENKFFHILKKNYYIENKFLYILKTNLIMVLT